MIWVCNSVVNAPEHCRNDMETLHTRHHQTLARPLWQVGRGRWLEGAHWKGDRQPQIDAVRREWEGCKAILAVSDGSFRRAEDGVLACVWVLGRSSSIDEQLTGTEEGRRATVVGRGGMEFVASGMQPSSYLAELAGLLEVLRGMMECVQDGQRAGAVIHFCDNASVVQLVRLRDRLTRRHWRSRPCRRLWGEIRGRLAWWTAHGGSWTTEWVRGHVDGDASRTSDSYTVVAEQLNFKADSIASQMQRREEGGGLMGCVHSAARRDLAVPAWVGGHEWGKSG